MEIKTLAELTAADPRTLQAIHDTYPPAAAEYWNEATGHWGPVCGYDGFVDPSGCEG